MKADRITTLDIGVGQIQMGVFAIHSSEPLELLDYGVEPYGTDLDSGMAREAVVATALKRLLDRKKPSCRKVFMAIEGQSVFSRLVKLPPVPPEKVVQTIGHEAVQNIPFPINEVAWDSYLANPDVQEPEVLLVAVKSDLVDGLVHAVEANRLAVNVVDVAPAALVNVVRYSYPDSAGSPSLLVDVGAHSCNLVFMDGDRVFFRTLPVTGVMFSRLIQEIERSITFFRKQQGGKPPQRILLAGGDGDPTEFSDRLGVPAEKLDPLRKINAGSGIPHAANLGVLIGLAVRDATPKAVKLNLLPESLKNEQFFRNHQPLLAACAAVAVTIGLVWIAGEQYMADLSRQVAKGTETRIRALEKIEKQLVPLENEIRAMEGKSDAYQKILLERIYWLEILTELEQRLPDGMFLLVSEPLRHENVINGMRVIFVSYLDKEPAGEDAVIRLRDSLRASRYFSDDTKVFKRPAKGLFARQFTLDVVFKEPVP